MSHLTLNLTIYHRFSITCIVADGRCDFMDEISDKSGIVAFILAFFLGGFGAHNFYVGKIGKGIFYLFSFGGFFIGVWIDIVKILINKFKDKDDKILDFHGEVKNMFKK